MGHAAVVRQNREAAMTGTLGSVGPAPRQAGRAVAHPVALVAVLVVVLVGMAGCDEIVFDGDSRGPATVDGAWIGNVASDIVEMTLQQPDSATVAGFGVLRRPGSARAFRVEGVRDGSRITLLLEISVTSFGDTGVAFAHYGARFVGANRIEGHLSGAGYSDAPMTLQPDRRIR